MLILLYGMAVWMSRLLHGLFLPLPLVWGSTPPSCNGAAAPTGSLYAVRTLSSTSAYTQDYFIRNASSCLIAYVSAWPVGTPPLSAMGFCHYLPRGRSNILFSSIIFFMALYSFGIFFVFWSWGYETWSAWFNSLNYPARPRKLGRRFLRRPKAAARTAV